MPFKPGQSGNPSGAQTRRPWTAALQRALAQYKNKKLGIKEGEALRYLADLTVKDAIEKKIIEARDEITNRLEGKPVQAIAGPGGEDVFKPLADAAESFRKAWKK